jgi:hypothetical protein
MPDDNTLPVRSIKHCAFEIYTPDENIAARIGWDGTGDIEWSRIEELAQLDLRSPQTPVAAAAIARLMLTARAAGRKG